MLYQKSEMRQMGALAVPVQLLFCRKSFMYFFHFEYCKLACIFEIINGEFDENSVEFVKMSKNIIIKRPKRTKGAPLSRYIMLLEFALLTNTPPRTVLVKVPQCETEWISSGGV